MMTHPLLPKLRQLRLSGMLETLDVRATQAVERQLAPIEFLALLLDDELERRNQSRLARHLAQSGCDSQKTLAHFDFAAAPGVNRTLIQDLSTCTYITRHENILLCGPTGVGKSHLAHGLGIEALKRDFRVLSDSVHHLLKSLHVTRASGGHTRLWNKILKADLLILDDFGLYPLTPQAAQDLYEIISERYERASIIITSNRAFEEWAEVFSNDLLASAALDRLTHHTHTLTIRGTEDGLLLDRLLITNDVAWRPATDESMSLELMKARPMTTPGTETLLLPSRRGRFSVILSNPQARALSFSVEIERIPKGMTVAPAAASADVVPGGQRLVTFDVQAHDSGARGHVHVLAKAAGQAKRLVMPVRVLARPIVLVQTEAESAVVLPEGAKIVDCDECSGGRCVEYTEGSVVVELELPEERDYIIWVRQFAPQAGFGHFANDGKQGFRLIGDWEDKLGRWSWLTSPRVPRHRWHAGKLRLSIKRRGDLFRRLDQVVVTDDPGFEPMW